MVAGLAAALVLLLNDREKLRDASRRRRRWSCSGSSPRWRPRCWGRHIECRLFEILPGIDFAFRVDALGMVFATISSLLWIVAAVYSIGYMRSLNEHAQTRFFACFATSLAAAAAAPSPPTCSRW